MNKIYKLSEQQPEEGKTCVLWLGAGEYIQCMFYNGSWYKIDDSGSVPSYTYYRSARLMDHWSYPIIQDGEKDSNETTLNIYELCKRVEALEDKINKLEKRMTPPVTDPLTPYTPYPVTPINPYYPWPTTTPPYDPIIYCVTCSVS